MELWRSIGGMLEVELTSAQPEAALGAVNENGIEITSLRQITDLTFSFRIYRREYSRLSALCKKRGESLRILGVSGIYWTGRKLLRRPVIMAGMLFLLLLVLYLPTRVFFIKVEGNHSVPARQILAAAEECGIRFGSSRRQVRSEKVKNALLAAVPQLQWAGVNTAGCVATISVRERAVQEEAPVRNSVTSLIAVRDGYVLSVTATQGNPLVQPGQTVRAGQTLISGFTDCGICIQATRAEGEVIAQTKREVEAVTPSQWVKQALTGDVKKKYSLLLGKKRINLWKDSGISGNSCGRIYEEYYVTLPGGFSLPAALCVETETAYVTENMELSGEEAEASLSGFGKRYILGQMNAGRIRDAMQEVSLEKGVYRLVGSYDCTEMIAKQQEQMGDTNGKDN